MPPGIPLSRQLIIVLHNGAILLEWEEGLGVDLLTGEFAHYLPGEIDHAVQNDELEYLKRAGCLVNYDEHQIFVTSFPELPGKTSKD